ncbi:MAG: FKBP-type peptidyl-prolyl cis-trans isomerase [Chitinophagaceae bacterium]|nr:FKBP-type peptidyl-prolyl cis-trans isomerase [Chitinophagaceae bacterium]
MKQFFYLAFCILALTACTGGFKKGEKGLEYKLIANGSGNKINYGDFIQLHVKQVYSGTKDTVLYDSHDFMPRIQVFDSVNTPLEYFKVMRNLRIGDSLVIRIPSDSLMKRMGDQIPSFMKKGKFMYTHVTLKNIFKTREQADSANKAERIIMKPNLFKKQMEDIGKELAKNKEQLAKDDKIIADYLTRNNIKAQKGKWGTYISVQTEGTGESINFNSIATVNYTGRTLDSAIVFDSNVDPKFQHAQPYEVKIWELMGQGSVIPGWTDALLQLKGGSKATLYIPSSLGYGTQGNGGVIKPNTNLIFDIEVKDVVSEEAYTAKQQKLQEEQMRKMQEQEKARTDSIEKAMKK